MCMFAPIMHFKSNIQLCISHPTYYHPIMHYRLNECAWSGYRPDASENVRVMSSPACVAARLAKVRVVDAPEEVSVAGPRRVPWERTAVMLVATDADLSER